MKKALRILPLLLILVLAACQAQASTKIGDIEVVSPWARAAASMAGMEGGGGNGGAFMLLKNSGSAPDKLIRAASDVAETVEIHQTIMEGDVMRMSPVEFVEIPAGGEVELKPGSYHVMLIGLKQDLKAGETINITLTFENAGETTVKVEVRAP